MTTDTNSPSQNVDAARRAGPWGVAEWVQTSAGLALAIVGGYLSMTNRWAMGGVVICIGLSIVPLRWLGLLGGAGMLVFAGLGWSQGRLGVLPALLIGVLGVVTITERVRRRSA